MSQIDTERVLSEDAEQDDYQVQDLKLVPVAESIRYRKRAQSAEKRLEALTEELAEAKTQAAALSEELADVRRERELTRKLAASGVVDLEAAVVLAKARMEGQSQADADGVIEQLRREKQYLFAEDSRTAGARKTAGAKERTGNTQTILEKAAKKAATTGDRADLQEYLKLRRNFL